MAKYGFFFDYFMKIFYLFFLQNVFYLHNGAMYIFYKALTTTKTKLRFR